MTTSTRFGNIAAARAGAIAACSHSNPILIAGAGPVGLTAAVELARRGIPIRIIDRAAEPTTLSKALGVNPRTLDLLEASGMTERILAAGRRIPGAVLRTPQRVLFRLRFAELDHRFPMMIALPQAETERLLRERLRELGFEVEWSTELASVSAEDPLAEIKRPDGSNEQMQPDWLIGTDGAHSTVRKSLGVDFPGEAMAGSFGLADLELDGPLEFDCVNVIFEPRRLLFALRVRDDIWRIASNDANIVEQLPPGFSHGKIIWQSEFRISHRMAARMHVGRCFLAGDAAHIHSPLGARGMNLGIEDACDLANRISKGDVSAYHNTRHKRDAAVVKQVEQLTNAAASGSPVFRFARAAILPVVMRFAAARRFVMHRITGLA